MKTISPELQAHLENDVTTLATCWRITRRDGITLGFTSHDNSLTLDGVTYEAASGFTPTAIESSAALNVDNLDIEGMLDSLSLAEADIIAGHYDFAEIEIFEVNYTDLTQGTLVLRYGWLGEVTMRGGQFVAEMRGLTQKLSHTIGEVYTPTCRAELGDARCGIDMTPRTVTGTLTGIMSSSVVQDSTREEDAGRYTHGVLTFTSGDNTGIATEIKAFANGQITLMLPLPYAPAIGDAYSLSEGCDKQFNTCKTRFANVLNFRGEPHVPGLDRMLETAATRSR